MSIPRRMAKRVVRHHLPIALGSTLVGGAVVYATWNPHRAYYTWSMATAYVGLLLLASTLLAGPVGIVRRGRYPLSTDLRRDLGVWAGGVALAHFAVGWQVHMKHRYLYWFREERAPGGFFLPRTDLFGFANYTGALAVVIVIVLLSISSDWALRRLGRARWKRWQRANYLLIGFVALHSAAYQLTEKRSLPWVSAVSAVVAALLVAQWWGIRAYRAQHDVARTK